jgi:hypothetical protein
LNLTREVVDVDEEEEGREDAALGSARTEWENVRADVGVGDKEGAIAEEVVDPDPQFALNTGIEEFEH